MGTGEVSASGGETEQEKKAQNPSFCRGWQSRGRRTARAVDERFRTRLMPRACVRCIRLRPATAQTLARKTRAARGCARIRSGSRPARDSAACHCVAGISTHLDGDLAVALEPLELKGSLLDDFMLDEGSDLLRGGRDARRQRDGDGARRGFQILGLEPRTRGGAHRRRQTNATASPPNGDEGSRTRPMRNGRQDRSWGVTHHVVPFPCASKEGEGLATDGAQIAPLSFFSSGLPISIPSPNSFAYKISSEIRKYGNIPHIIMCVIRLYFRDSNLPFDSEHD